MFTYNSCQEISLSQKVLCWSNLFGPHYTIANKLKKKQLKETGKVSMTEFVIRSLWIIYFVNSNFFLS